MRELKFRAWDKQDGEMVDLQSITPLALDDTMNNQLSMMGGSGIFIPLVDDTPIMQYTGLKDKNGKEIYEGDICRVTEPSNEYHDGLEYVGYVCYERNRFYVRCPKYHPEFEAHQYEVIGNIYENPELLK